MISIRFHFKTKKGGVLMVEFTIRINVLKLLSWLVGGLVINIISTIICKHFGL